MAEVMQPVAAGYTLSVWVEALCERLRDEVRDASPGHCLRVANLPRAVLEGAARVLAPGLPAGVELFLVDHGSATGTPNEPWRVGVHKVVERRNAEEGVVVALFPPDLQLAAGDSVDISTFRVVPTADLAGTVERRLLEVLPEETRARAQGVLQALQRRAWPMAASERIGYLATIASQPQPDEAAVGGALFALGLVPDFALLDRPEQLHYRLGQRNVRFVEQLAEPGATVLERVVRLPLEREEFGQRLISLFQRWRPEQVAEWGRAVATDPQWRDLSVDQWPLAEPQRPPGAVRIDIEPLRLPTRPEDNVRLLRTDDTYRVSWQTTPPPMDVPGLAHFQVEVVSSDRVVVWETPLIKVGTGKSARRVRKIAGLPGLDEGVYFFRVVALDAAGDPFPPQPLRDLRLQETANGDGEGQVGDGKRINESEDFLLVAEEDQEVIDEFEPVINTTVAGYAEAEWLARWGAAGERKDPSNVRMQVREWATRTDARSEAASAAIQFDVKHQYTVRLSQRLRRLEGESLAAAYSGGHGSVALDGHAGQWRATQIELSGEILAARQAVFNAIRSTQVTQPAEGPPGEPVVALADLCAIAPQIEQYARAYRDWLQSGHPDTLKLDVVRAQVPEYGEVALVSPLHPVRLLWLLQEQQLARAWCAEGYARRDAPAYLTDVWRDSVSARGIPAVLVLAAQEGYLDAGPLPGGWGCYLPPMQPDSRALLDLVRSRLAAGAAHQSEADVPPRVLADKLEAFLRQHPYTPALVINVINPGTAGLVLEALIDVEGRRRGLPGVRYIVRLFSDAPRPEDVGSAFAELQNPERPLSEAAERLTQRTTSFLFPKVTWSRNSLRRYLEEPGAYRAHVTVLIDSFGVALRIGRMEEGDRSSYVHGLVQEAPRRFTGRGRAFAWTRRVAPRACAELSSAQGRSALLADLLRAMGEAQAHVLAPNSDTQGTAAVAALELSVAAQSLLYSVHANSTWVLTLDAHLGVDYFDAARRPDRPGYLLDFTPEFLATGGRQLLLTTRIDEEVGRLVEPAAQQLGLEAEGQGPQLLIETLRSLSGRLALRLLSAPSQVQGALGMALTRLFLEAYDLLEQAVVIPLDAHPELAERALNPSAPQLRGDLLVASVATEARHLDFLLVETKCYGGEQVTVGADLRASITAQLTSSEAALRETFDPQHTEPDRIDRSVQTWRLSRVLSFYLERAERYGLVSGEDVEALRQFFVDLEGGYSLSVRKVGLVFRLEAPATECDRSDPDVPIWVVGKETVQRIVEEALRRFAEEARDEGEPDEDREMRRERRRATMTDHETWEDVRASLGGPAAATSGRERHEGRQEETSDADHAHQAQEAERTDKCVDEDGPPGGAAEESRNAASAHQEEDGTVSVPEPEQVVEVVDDQEITRRDAERAPGDADEAAQNRTAPVEYGVLLGDSQETPQYGLLGVVAAEPWRRVALDLNGCNTVSVFGVQGSGKSYTVGSVVEMAVRLLPGLNVLPRPLGAVVFHYHQTQDYPPEFVSMSHANDEPAQVAALRKWGAEPAGLEEVVVLTTTDTVTRRRQEFPGTQVEPIAFSSGELTVADWRFLMGATGNDALYLKLMNEVMRRNRAHLTLEAIREGITSMPLPDSHRSLAQTRLEFAARFIDDARSLRSLMRPGRLIVVDLRDEFIEKEQALGLFVTMLNVFAGAGMAGEPFNKLIVFDEAHKYMGGSLIQQVVEVIREMRHKGVSVLIASQDPVNVPPAVIELSSAVVLHRFNSPAWLRHIQRSLSALGDLTAPGLASLGAGESYVWANRATDATFTRRALKVRMRPRATKHGGSTRTAVTS